ncbi:hypothetical protein B0H19DRAFT_1123819 [Mycena capillaripes]|nr:hypothetical protein B0H19DRAFT_1123819 [Mycena capillaripes]
MAVTVRTRKDYGRIRYFTDRNSAKTGSSVPIRTNISKHFASHLNVQLQKVIRAVRSSLQRRRQYIVAEMHMLIFDVRTRWSSTHQMMSTLSTYNFASVTDPRYYVYPRFCSCPGTSVFGCISLRRSSLKPDTFRTFILLKHHLHLKCKVLEDAHQPTEKL